MSEQDKSLGQTAIDAFNSIDLPAADFDKSWEFAAQAVAARVRAETIEECAALADDKLGDPIIADAIRALNKGAAS